MTQSVLKTIIAWFAGFAALAGAALLFSAAEPAVGALPSWLAAFLTIVLALGGVVLFYAVMMKVLAWMKF